MPSKFADELQHLDEQQQLPFKTLNIKFVFISV